MAQEKIRDLLESIFKYYTKRDGQSNMPMYVKQQLNQALKLLSQPKDQPSSELDTIVEEFIKDLQWDLRDSHNSSSCLNQKQRDFLKEKLENLLIVRLDTSEASRRELVEACKYSHTLLLRKIGQTTHAVALLEAAITNAKKGLNQCQEVQKKSKKR